MKIIQHPGSPPNRGSPNIWLNIYITRVIGVVLLEVWPVVRVFDKLFGRKEYFRSRPKSLALFAVAKYSFYYWCRNNIFIKGRGESNASLDLSAYINVYRRFVADHVFGNGHNCSFPTTHFSPKNHSKIINNFKGGRMDEFQKWITNDPGDIIYLCLLSNFQKKEILTKFTLLKWQTRD